MNQRPFKKPFSFSSNVWRGWLVVCLLLAFGGCQNDEPTPPDKVVFWTSGNQDAPSLFASRIRYGQVPEISSRNDLGEGFAFQFGFALDHAKNQLYFFSADSLVRQLSYDLSGLQVVGNLGKGKGFGSNAPNGNVGNMLLADGQLYWSQTTGSGNRSLIRANTDGKGYQVLYAAQDADSIGSQGLARPDGGAFLYWGTEKKVWRGKPDGSTAPSVLYDFTTDASKGSLNDIAVWKDKLYLATTQGLWTANLDGSGGLNRLFTAETEKAMVIKSISVDPTEGQLYWFCLDPKPVANQDFQFLYRGNPDGTAAKKLLERRDGQQLRVD